MTGLENMPNVGTVSVAVNPASVTLGGSGADATTAVWVVTFTSAVSETADFPNLLVRLLTLYLGVFHVVLCLDRAKNWNSSFSLRAWMHPLQAATT